MVKSLHHLPLVQRHPHSTGAIPTIPADGEGAFPLLQLLFGAEQVGVVGHMEHSGVLHRPGFLLFPCGTIHQDGETLIDAHGELCVPAAAEDGGCAGVGIDAGKVFRSEGKTVLWIGKFFRAVEEKGATGRGRRC